MARDLMHGTELKQLVREAYASIDQDTTAVGRKLYDPDQLDLVPVEAASRALGVNNHLRFADIQPGETVIDLGCGAGIDTVIAAHRVGPEGRVIALDFLPEMLERTSAAAAAAGLGNVETVEGEIESIPLPEDSVDHIISNGVINLSPRKSRVLAECSRIARRGARLCVSDLAVEEESLPTEVLTHPAAWAG